jgi:hypothetical protein
MGLFDRFTFEAGLDVESPDLGADPLEVTWQTKSIARHEPMLENYKATAEGRLFKEDAEYEHVPGEERSRYNEEIGGFETEIERARGSGKKIHQGWSDTEYTGYLSSTESSMATTLAAVRSTACSLLCSNRAPEHSSFTGRRGYALGSLSSPKAFALFRW